jgi:acylphosphatase
VKVAKRGRVEGRVQGVGFRYYTQREAQELGLCGWVQNLADGSVAFEVSGEETQVRAFLEWLGRGPRLAEVRAVHAESLDLDSASPVPFELRR